MVIANEGNSLAHSLLEASPVKAKIMLNTTEILTQLQKNLPRIKAFGVKRTRLFGSYASGHQTSRSDIDILVEFEKGQKSFDHYMDLKFFLEDLFRCKVDLVIAESIKPDLQENILRSVKYVT